MMEQDDASGTEDEVFEDEIFAREDVLAGKGVRPMLSGDMINFLQYVSRAHPEIHRIQSVSEQKLEEIAQEFGVPLRVLQASIAALRNPSREEGYDRVRAEQQRLGL